VVGFEKKKRVVPCRQRGKEISPKGIHGRDNHNNFQEGQQKGEEVQLGRGSRA